MVRKRNKTFTISNESCSCGLEEMPKFNSSLDSKEENLVLKSYYNIGVAVDTPSGLVVPSIKDVNKKDYFDLSKELMDISARAQDKKLSLMKCQDQPLQSQA